MPGIGEPGEHLALVEVGAVEAHVHQVRAAQVGIVRDVDIPRPDVPRTFDDGLGTELHGSDEDRQAELALGDQRTGVLVIDAVGAVQGL